MQRALSPATVSSIVLDEENKSAQVFLKPKEVSLAIGRGGLNIKLAGMITGYNIDVFRESNDEEELDDIYLDEFTDEIDVWVVEALKQAGLQTAREVLKLSREALAEMADLELNNVDDVLNILNAEFEQE